MESFLYKESFKDTTIRINKKYYQINLFLLRMYIDDESRDFDGDFIHVYNLMYDETKNKYHVHKLQIFEKYKIRREVMEIILWKLLEHEYSIKEYEMILNSKYATMKIKTYCKVEIDLLKSLCFELQFNMQNGKIYAQDYDIYLEYNILQNKYEVNVSNLQYKFYILYPNDIIIVTHSIPIKWDDNLRFVLYYEL